MLHFDIKDEEDFLFKSHIQNFEWLQMIMLKSNADTFSEWFHAISSSGFLRRTFPQILLLKRIAQRFHKWSLLAQPHQIWRIPEYK